MMPFANLIGHGNVAVCPLNEIRVFCDKAGLNVEKLIRTHKAALGSDNCDRWYVGDMSEKIKEYENVEIV